MRSLHRVVLRPDSASRSRVHSLRTVIETHQIHILVYLIFWPGVERIRVSVWMTRDLRWRLKTSVHSMTLDVCFHFTFPLKSWSQFWRTESKPRDPEHPSLPLSSLLLSSQSSGPLVISRERPTSKWILQAAKHNRGFYLTTSSPPPPHLSSSPPPPLLPVSSSGGSLRLPLFSWRIRFSSDHRDKYIFPSQRLRRHWSSDWSSNILIWLIRPITQIQMSLCFLSEFNFRLI